MVVTFAHNNQEAFWRIDEGGIGFQHLTEGTAINASRHVIAMKSPLVINDAFTHPLLSPSIKSDSTIFAAYCGAPLMDEKGEAWGAIGVIKAHLYQWLPDEIFNVQEVAAEVVKVIHFGAQKPEA